jgi:ubiquitin-conjugating enzyme E2 Q
MVRFSAAALEIFSDLSCSDFLEIVACSPNYRPGFIRFGNDSFALTVSVPAVSIPIPPNVLQAWDRALLGSFRHFTLLITGLQNVYPVLLPDGTFTLEALRKNMSLKFQVGLTPRHKPSKPHAQAAARSFMLVAEEKEDSPEPDPMDEDYSMDISFVPETKHEEPEDPGVFDRFALSQALEALLDHNFLNILRIRLKFKVGWAGAELMQSTIDKTQAPADNIFSLYGKACFHIHFSISTQTLTFYV